MADASRALLDAMFALGNELGQEASRAGDHLAREGMAVMARSRRDHAACLHDLARADSPFAAWLICSDYLRRSLAFSMVEGQELMAPLRALRRGAGPRG